MHVDPAFNLNMNSSRLLVGVVLLLGTHQTLAQSQSETQNTSDAYELSVGDTIEINVFEEPDLQKELKISASGEISYPLIGTLTIVGMTTEELEQELTERLAGRYIRNPKLTVVIKEYRKFYVNGAVNTPGGYPYQPGMTVRKAIALAGGLSPRASSRKIYLIEEEDKSREMQKVKLDDAVGPGDILQINEGLF